MSSVVAVVGATGAVGREMLRTLERRNFPAKKVIALASKRSAGKTVPYAGPGSTGSELTVLELTSSSFEGVDIALFSAGSDTAKEFGPIAASAGATVIDNSSAWRMNDQCPLVCAEVNPEAAAERPLGIIANPNCGTMQLLVALKPLHTAARLTHVVVSTYQATSGKGHEAVEELRTQTRALVEGTPIVAEVFPCQMAQNVVCDWTAGSDGYSEEEMKIIEETRKILAHPTLAVSPTCVRVPVETGHSESVHLQFERPMDAKEACDLLRNAPGIVLNEIPYGPGTAPQPIDAAGTDPVYVGRVRNDLTLPGALNLWVVADNLRKGAALNAIQIAELLV